MGASRTEFVKAPEHVWALARADYESGMTAKAVCARYGVREAGLRGRAHRERWCKEVSGRRVPPRAVKDADPAPEAPRAPAPTDQVGIAPGALARASEALLAGRPGEATAIVRALDDVLPLAEAFGTPVDLAPSSPEEVMDFSPELQAKLQKYVETLAEILLSHGEVPERHAAFAFRWRAERLGPAAAASDRAYAERMGWTEKLYDGEGRLREG